MATRTELINHRVWLIFGPAETYIAQTVSDQKFRTTFGETLWKHIIVIGYGKNASKATVKISQIGYNYAKNHPVFMN